MLLVGLGWPVLSWLIWLPGRYYAADVPGRLARADYQILIDPNTVWPLGHTPGWMIALWFVPAVGSYAAIYGPALLFSVGLVGGLSAGRHPAARGVPLLVVASVVLGIVLLAVSISAATLVTDVVVGAFGIAAVALGAVTATLSRRTRAALIAIGAGTVPLLLSLHTVAGEAMYVWLAD
ncbi:hypothetical protein ACWKSP_13445 [Micromonosporaceae bacterium Da 78-11]